MTNKNMIKPAFEKKYLDEEKIQSKSIVMTIRMNQKEIQMLDEVKKALEQPKDSTAIKHLFYVGYFDVLHDKKTSYILSTLFKNKRNNYRTGALVE